MAHHRDEFGPTSPTSRSTAATRSPATRCAASSSATRPARPAGSSSRACCAACASDDAGRALAGPAHRRRRSSCSSRSAIALGHPWVYFILWLAPYLTVWRVINRLRSIAEHGGMQRSKDRRAHDAHGAAVAGRRASSLVPYHIGWHLAHHVDSGVPMANLPKLHAELARAGLRHRRARVPELPRALAQARRRRRRPQPSRGRRR